MLTPFDDHPVHQLPVPLAHAGAGHPDFYDRFWFNGYTEDFYFAMALGLYPNRGVIDAAFAVVDAGVQRSVFASGPIPLDRRSTSVGPLSVQVVDPLRVNRVRVEAPAHGLEADITATARTAAFEEPRQTHYVGNRLVMDVTRATQMTDWAGAIRAGGRDLDLSTSPVRGTKDRSWGVRPVGEPTPAAPSPAPPQVFFLWVPLNFDDECLHYMVFEDASGTPWSHTAVVLPVIGRDDPVVGDEAGFERVSVARRDVVWASGLRRASRASLELARSTAPVPARGGEGPVGTATTVDLEPVLTFRMRGAGYMHPSWGHGRWHGGLEVGGESHRVEDLDTPALDCVHVQQVVRATWGDRRGLGVLEQLAIGPHAPSGFQGLLDGAR
ncbi:MAG: hypothetical protein ACRDYY_04265 [Acidimicrobiales bacterium]